MAQSEERRRNTVRRLTASAPQQYLFMVKDTEREVKRRYFGEKKKEEKIKDISEENKKVKVHKVKQKKRV